MRNLTVKREKSFVACLITMKVFAEDKEHGETVIDGTPCRRIGELKNGEEKTFPIGEDDVKIFVIADELSKSFCFDCYALPAGSEDVFLSGRNRFSLSSGNSFRFDNNDSAESRRKKSGHRGTAVMIISVIDGAVCGIRRKRGAVPRADLRMGEIRKIRMTCFILRIADFPQTNPKPKDR